MNISNRFSSLSRQSTPKRKEINSSFSSLASEVNYEKNNSYKLENRINKLERYASNFISRSTTPMSSIMNNDQKVNLDLNQVSKKTTLYPYKAFSKKAITDRKEPVPVAATPFQILPTQESDIEYSRKNIENLRSELQQRRELIVGLKQTVSRKQLEHKYWGLVSEIEEITSRILELKRYNDEIRRDIVVIKNNDF